MIPPELIGMHLSIPAHTSYAAPRIVPLVHFKEPHNLPGAIRVFFHKTEIEIGPVGMIIDGEDFRFHTFIE